MTISEEDKNTINYDVIQKMEEEWPEMTEEFKKIQKQQMEKNIPKFLAIGSQKKLKKVMMTW